MSGKRQVEPEYSEREAKRRFEAALRGAWSGKVSEKPAPSPKDAKAKAPKKKPAR
jgi:hypothetical protein